MNKIPVQDAWPLLILAGLLLITQGTWLFLHARKHGRKAWFWGLWGMIQFPWPALTYALLIWWNHRRRHHHMQS